MANVEVSKNIGPHQEKSLDSITETTESSVFYSDHYTIHSYQVILNGTPDGDTDLTFEILCTNDDGNQDGPFPADSDNYQAVASYNITNAINSAGIMYSDVWNFKYAKCKITVTDLGSVTNVSVIEKHNA